MHELFLAMDGDVNESLAECSNVKGLLDERFVYG
jgi:hypothetical protein